MAAALFQTKLRSFSKQLERRQAERELLQELARFSNKVGEGESSPAGHGAAGGHETGHSVLFFRWQG